jgi:hypothetical protein
MPGVCHHVQLLLIEVGSQDIFAQVGLKTIILPMSTSGVARVIGVSHHTLQIFSK